MKTLLVRQIAVVASVAAAIMVPVVQMGVGLGLSQAEFAGQGDTTLRAAGYAFSIWGLIYLGLAAYAVFQARSRDTALLSALGWPSAVAIAACALWIVAAAANLRAASVIIILVGAAAAVRPLLRRPEPASKAERFLALWPLAALAGWLTIAAALNILTVMTAERLIPADQAAVWAVAGVAVVFILGTLVALKTRSAIYPLPIAWGLLGVFVAERTDQPLTADLAAAGAAGLVVLALSLVVRPARA